MYFKTKFWQENKKKFIPYSFFELLHSYLFCKKNSKNKIKIKKKTFFFVCIKNILILEKN